MSYSVSNVSMAEGKAGRTAFEFTVTDIGGQDGDAVYYQTRDGSATAASGDYQATSGFLTFSGGTTAMIVDVDVNGDSLYEGDETFYLNLYQKAATSTATVTTTVGVTSTTTETDTVTATSTAYTTQTATAYTTDTVTATATTTATAYTTDTVTATATTTATAYTTQTQTVTSLIADTVTFLTSSTVITTSTVLVTDTRLISAIPAVSTNDARFASYVKLADVGPAATSQQATIDASTPDGYTLLAAQGTATILNDDPAPAFSIVAGAAVAEGDQLVFTVTRTNGAQDPETVTVRTSDGTATQGRDYTANAQALTFTLGQLTQTFAVQTERDGLYDGATPETVNATLSLPTGGASIAPAGMTAAGGIVDLDSAPALALSPANVTHPEGSGGETDFVYTVTRTGDAQPAQTVIYSVAGSGAHPADANDFVGGRLPSGTLTFTTGQSTQAITVRVAGDGVAESDEGFTVSLSGQNFGTVGPATATGTITDDDTAPSATTIMPTTTMPPAGTPTTSMTTTGTPTAGTPTPPVSAPPGSQGSAHGGEQVTYAADGSVATRTRTRANGQSTVDVEASGQTVHLQPFQVVRNHHESGNTFVFDPGDGIDVIYGFNARGSGHDTLDLPSSDFKNFADVLKHTGDIGGSAWITDPKTGEAIRLAGVKAADLKRKDFDFHE